MFQCLGLGTVETGGCGEDWYHPECMMGLPRNWHASQVNNFREPNAEEKPENGETTEKEEPLHPVPTGFPNEEDFEAMICYKCVESNPWIKRYAGTPGFLPPVFRKDEKSAPAETATAQVTGAVSLKRKASDSDLDARPPSPSKRLKDEVEHPSKQGPPLGLTASATNGTSLPPSSHNPPSTSEPISAESKPQPKHAALPSNPPTGNFSLFLQSEFRDHLCHCPSCYPQLIPHPQLVDDEDTYEPSLSDSDASQHAGNTNGGGSSRASILERGEAALSNVDRVRAIEGVMVYNHLRDKVKEFLKPYAEDGRVVSAEDIKAYFEKLRGDENGIKEARDEVGGEADNRREQSGY